MKVWSHLLLVFNLQQQKQPQPSLSLLGGIDKNKGSILRNKDEELRNVRIQALLEEIQQVGPVGCVASEQDQKRIAELASLVIPFSDYPTKPAYFPLVGEHKLIYSDAKGPSSGRIEVFGQNVIGKVSQWFENETLFYNKVAFGPLQIALQVRRDIKNDSTIKVTFLNTKISLWGMTLKENETKGGGIWKVQFVGKYQDPKDGKCKLIRIMNTPALFILEQTLDE